MKSPSPLNTNHPPSPETAPAFWDRPHSVYGVCISLNTSAFSLLQLTLEFFPEWSQGLSPGSLSQGLTETWDKTILLGPLLLQHNTDSAEAPHKSPQFINPSQALEAKKTIFTDGLFTYGCLGNNMWNPTVLSSLQNCSLFSWLERSYDYWFICLGSPSDHKLLKTKDCIFLVGTQYQIGINENQWDECMHPCLFTQDSELISFYS